MPIAGSTHGAYPPVGRIAPAVGLYHRWQRTGTTAPMSDMTVGTSEKEADGHSYVLFGTVIVPLYPSPEV